ncbi:MAG: S1 RNA-binding domain-containing protein [Chitinispirillaceae bacterium]|nr:S1 RNA-binding domain-containing protein [Chitinispirillaceae bacterium]
MRAFSKQIAEKWNISSAIAELVCDAFEKGDTPYYLAEYRQETAVEIPLSCLWEIFDFLEGMEELSSKKKRVLNALKKAGKQTHAIERRVNFLASPFELDDMLLPLRPNPRSRGQLAIKKGLEPLADLVMRQEEQDAPVEELARQYVGKDPSLKSASEVVQGVKDVLAERFAYDDTVRAMVREFAYDDGFIEVTPKNKQDPQLIRFIGKQVLVRELTKEDALSLLSAEKRKTARVKLGVQLFRITELLRHHFIVNPDFSGFDLICQIIDESWNRLLQPVVERDVKIRLLNEAEDWASLRIGPELEKKFAEDSRHGPVLVADASHQKYIHFIVLNGHGELLAATSEKKAAEGKIPSYERLRQFCSRHRPVTVVISGNEQAEIAESLVRQIVPSGEGDYVPEIVRFSPETGMVNPAGSSWLQTKYESLLDNDMRRLFGIGILYLRPVMLLPMLGTGYYSIHPLQNVLEKERFIKMVRRLVSNAALCRGIMLKDIADSPIAGIKIASSEILQAMRAVEAKEPVATKNELLKVPGMTEVLFRNIAGFLILPYAEDPRDRSLVHPDHFLLLEEASEQLNVSLDTIMAEPEALRSFVVEDFIRKAFIEKKLIEQVRSNLRHAAVAASRMKRKFKLSELKEGSVVSGRVTNITPFGVFININAVCDGLIHISQLADEYVETPDQVVALHDKVDVRILKVDVKKRRISLSMKNLGSKKGPRVKPSQGQLNTLAEHFNAR